MNISSFFTEGNQWAQLLHSLSDDTKKSEARGILLVATTSFSIKLLKPCEGTIGLIETIDISKKILILNHLSPTDRKELKKGLEHLDSLVRKNIDTHRLMNTAAFYEAVEFYDEIKVVIEELKEETPGSCARKQVMQVLNERKLQVADFERVQLIIGGNHSLLFHLTSYDECFFEGALPKCQVADMLPLLAAVVKDFNQLESCEVSKIKQLLFKVQGAGASLFELLMKREDCNQLFDVLLDRLSDDELNDNEYKKLRVFDFIHSITRYHYIFLKEENMSSKMGVELDVCYKKACLKFSGSIQETYSDKPFEYAQWLRLRRNSSKTVKMDSSSVAEQWNKAEQLRVAYCQQHKGTNIPFDWSMIQELHIKLSKGEKDITSPGQFRKEIARTSGGWRHLFCPINYLPANVDQFMKWFNAGLVQCENKQLNPILLAAQTYQRFVSLHPFENGNGRVSRFLMDYVLERFYLPAPILKEEVLDGVFPLEPLKCHEPFLRKIIKGIEESQLLLRGK